MKRDKHLYCIIATLLTLFIAAGCSGSSESSVGEPPNLYTANLGTATLFDMREKTRQFLDRYQFRVIRFESTTDATFYETEWKPRYPFDDEVEQGIEEARTRIVITATPRSRGAIGSDANTVRLEAENQVRYKGALDWHYIEMSKMLKAYLREFADKLSTEFRAGLRKY